MVSQSQYLNDVFQEPPLIAYKRQRNIKDYPFRAKVPPFNPPPKRLIKGMSKCGKQCLICPYIMVGKSITAEHFVWNLSKAYTCGTSNIVYLIECNKERCHKRYIGQTDKTLNERILQHLGYIRNNVLSKATGQHFNSPGHTIHNLTVTIIEQVKKRNPIYRKEREKIHINKLNTSPKGLNRMS